MEIRPNANVGPVEQPTSPRAARETPRAGQDTASLSGAEALATALQRVATVRPEAVDRAAGLIGDVQYPPLTTIRALAHLLAVRFDSAS